MTGAVGTVFFLPGLGFGAAAAAPLAAALGERMRVVGIDLPGQGGAPDAPNGSVAAQVDSAIAVIEAQADGGPWMLVAHSMGGKVAALVAGRVLGGEANVYGLAGAVLLAPSPVTPEPMDDDKRAQMLGWVADGPVSESDAREFIAQNVASPLADAAEMDAVAQVQRTSPLAWRRWLEEGSLEDASEAVGVLDLPVVVLAGEDDADLGASAQPGLAGPVYPRARFVSLPGTGHLLPYERPAEVAEAIIGLWESTVGVAPQVPADWGRLIASDRTAVEGRGLLARRALADDPDYAPRALGSGQLALLRALAARLLPQPAGGRIDLAARVDADLAAGRGDGWRPAGLPADAAAYRLGLDALAPLWPADAAAQDALIARLVAGDLALDTPPAGGGPAAGGGATDTPPDGGPAADTDAPTPLSGELLVRWFEDARNDLTRIWLAHPASLARLGYDGFATSGPGDGPPGYQNLAAGQRDAWEPADLGILPSPGGPTSGEPTPDGPAPDGPATTASTPTRTEPAQEPTA